MNCIASPCKPIISDALKVATINLRARGKGREQSPVKKRGESAGSKTMSGQVFWLWQFVHGTELKQVKFAKCLKELSSQRNPKLGLQHSVIVKTLKQLQYFKSHEVSKKYILPTPYPTPPSCPPQVYLSRKINKDEPSQVDPGAIEGKAWRRAFRERTRSFQVGQQRNFLQCWGRESWLFLLSRFDNYCEMIPNVTKGHWLIAVTHFFSIIENSHVLVAENISFQICFYLFNWRTTARQYCVGFHHTTWISHEYTHVSFLLNLLPTSHPSRLSQNTGLSNFPQTIYFMYGNIYVSVPHSQFTPSFPSPAVSHNSVLCLCIFK